MFQDSIFQTSIFNEVKDPARRNIIIDAVAGSGKTTTIVRSLSMIPVYESTIFLAFNKDIVKELKGRVPAHVRVATMHSNGLNELRYHFGKDIIIDNDKVAKVIEIESFNWGLTEEEKVAYCDRVEKLVNMFRFALPQSPQHVIELCEKFDIELLNGEVERAKQVLLICRKNVKSFDFMDMIYFPAFHSGMKLKKFKNVFVDECQDLNAAQHEMIKKMVDPKGGRLIAVGDPHQAIYGFTGADSDSFDKLKNLFPNTIELPLSVSYRCGASIIAHSQTIVPHIQALPGAAEGIVKIGSFTEIKDGDFVLCRNTKPLVSLCMKFIAEGKKATIKGKDFGKNLIDMIKKAKAKSNDAFFNHMDREYNKLKTKLAAKNPGKDVEKLTPIVILTDKINALKAIALASKSNQTADMIITIEKIFSDDEKTGIILSTMHKSKGLEADNVFIIEAQLNPAYYAQQEWQMVQEQNLMYVARTRAKSKLCYVSDWISDEDNMKHLKKALQSLGIEDKVIA